MKEQLEVTDLKGNKIGVMNVRKYINIYHFIDVHIGTINTANAVH